MLFSTVGTAPSITANERVEGVFDVESFAGEPVIILQAVAACGRLDATAFRFGRVLTLVSKLSTSGSIDDAVVGAREVEVPAGAGVGEIQVGRAVDIDADVMGVDVDIEAIIGVFVELVELEAFPALNPLTFVSPLSIFTLISNLTTVLSAAATLPASCLTPSSVLTLTLTPGSVLILLFAPFTPDAAPLALRGAAI